MNRLIVIVQKNLCNLEWVSCNILFRSVTLCMTISAQLFKMKNVRCDMKINVKQNMKTNVKQSMTQSAEMSRYENSYKQMMIPMEELRE